MDFALSSRMERTLGEFLPTRAAAAPPRHYNPTTAVDLSSAQNEVLRPELLEFFKSIVDDKATSQVSHVILTQMSWALLIANRCSHYHLTAVIHNSAKHLHCSSTLISARSIVSHMRTLCSLLVQAMLLKTSSMPFAKMVIVFSFRGHHGVSHATSHSIMALKH
jgi:hypothetical protein